MAVGNRAELADLTPSECTGSLARAGTGAREGSWRGSWSCLTRAIVDHVRRHRGEIVLFCLTLALCFLVVRVFG